MPLILFFRLFLPKPSQYLSKMTTANCVGFTYVEQSEANIYTTPVQQTTKVRMVLNMLVFEQLALDVEMETQGLEQPAIRKERGAPNLKAFKKNKKAFLKENKKRKKHFRKYINTKKAHC